MFAIGLSAQSELDHIVMPRTGLQLPRQLSFEKWLGIGRQLSTVSTSSAWCLGDWLNYGEAAYTGRYRDAVEHTSLDYQTLRNYAWVAKRFSLSRRRDTLSFGHHAELAALPEPEQDFWLRKAEDLSWSRNQLRREVRASLKQRSADDEPGEAAGQRESTAALAERQPGLNIQINLTPEQLELCEVAATRAGLSIETWAITALEQAACQGSELTVGHRGSAAT